MEITTLKYFFTLVIGQILTIIGIYITYRRNRRLYLYQRQTEASIKRMSEQLGTFYGPINMLLQRASAAHKLLIASIGASDDTQAESLMNNHLMPLNEKIASIIMENSHLLHENDSPKQYQEFLQHVDSLRFRLSQNSGNSITTVPYPEFFAENVENMTHKIRKSYIDGINFSHFSDSN